MKNLRSLSAKTFLKKLLILSAGTALTLIGLGTQAKTDAALVKSYQFNGKGNWSIDAVGGNTTPVGTLEAFVPSGSNIETAFLYSSNFNGNSVVPNIVFDGTSYGGSDFISLGVNNASISLGAYRADVTSQVASKIGNGGGTFSFQIDSENPNNTIDGEVLAVVYSNPTEEERTIAFLDGFSASSGDTTTVNLANPLDLTTPNFESLLSLGIGFGFQPSNQFSTVDIDGRRLTSSAGGQDDGFAANGALITVGGIGDSPTNPSDPFAAPSGPNTDDELYNLALGNGIDPSPFLTQGSTSFTINTLNPSSDDNIFFAGINVTARASVNEPVEEVPEPITILGTLVAGGFGVSFSKKRKSKSKFAKKA